MSLFTSLKRFFGFGKKAIPTPSLSTAEVFIAKIAALPEGERAGFIEQTRVLAEAEAVALLGEVRGQTGRAQEFFTKAKEHFAWEVAIAKQQYPDADTKEKFVPAYELLLRRLINYAEVFALPSPEIVARLDQYIQQFEEPIYLSEARGEYKLAVSENGRWLRMPFADPAIIKPARRVGAQKELQHLFVSCPQLVLLETETRIPWQPISFIELTQKVKDTRITLLELPGDKQSHYYCYIYT